MCLLSYNAPGPFNSHQQHLLQCKNTRKIIFFHKILLMWIKWSLRLYRDKTNETVWNTNEGENFRKIIKKTKKNSWNNPFSDLYLRQYSTLSYWHFSIGLSKTLGNHLFYQILLTWINWSHRLFKDQENETVLNTEKKRWKKFKKKL